MQEVLDASLDYLLVAVALLGDVRLQQPLRVEK